MPGKTRTWAILLTLSFTVIISFAQVLYKMASANLSFNPLQLITNWQLILGLVLYAIAAIMFIKALKGGELSVLYPLIAVTYIWVSLLSIYFFHEVMTLYKWLGVVTIILGVSFIGIGGTR